MKETPNASRLDKKYVHKTHEENVLIRAARQISSDPEEFECEMIIDPHHAFFFEHPADHVPGIMIVEAGRQCGLAISHLFLHVPIGTQFISKEFKVRFATFAELTEPITIRSRFVNRTYRHDVLSEALLEGEFYQNGKQVASMEGDWKMFPAEIYHRFREHESTLRSEV
jgi:2-oxo-3-(phosphooxy)propyl 3-oxoalkanoate synthase